MSPMLPTLAPGFASAFTSSFALSFKIEIMAEIIAGSTKPGLGSAIKYATTSDPSNMVPIFAYSLIAIVIMLIITGISSILKRKYEE